MKNKKKISFEKIILIGLIVLTLISLICNYFEFAYSFYNDSTYNFEKINDFLIKYNLIIIIDNLLLYLFAITYIVLSIKSKKEVLLKVSLSIFSILSTMCVITLITNEIAEAFGVFA